LCWWAWSLVSRGDPAVGAAAGAGLEQVVLVLAGGWSARGIRVNGVLASADLAAAAGPCRFLVSDSAAALSGQLLRAAEPGPG
jgi:hypothetical protein